MNQSHTLRIGVIGWGNRAPLAIQAHKPGEGLHVTAAADPHEPALARFREKFGPDAFVTTDYRQLLARPEIGAVFITSPDFLHEEHAVAALEAGKAVYLEKPMAITIAGCDRILRTAYETKKALFVGHNMRYMSVMMKMKELIDKGTIGEVKAGWCRHFISYGGDAYYRDWHAERSKGTGLLLQKGAHDIDMLHWFCGGFSTRVNAMGALTLYGQVKNRIAPGERGVAAWDSGTWPPLKQEKLNHTIDVEDLNMMQMVLDNGAFCSYQQCHYAPDGWRNYTIIGTEGRLENFNDAPGQSVVRVWNKRTFYNPYGDEQHFIPSVDGGHGGADPIIVADFLGLVRGTGKPRISPIAARNSVAAGCQATESLRNGGAPRDVPPVAKEILEYFSGQVATHAV